MLSVPKIIQKKRDGGELTPKEINYFIQSLTKNAVADSQIGAMLMAIFLKGMNFQETVDLTKAMVNSGQTLNFPNPSNLVDKHSTGGVGDKISLILAPALAACGFKVPMVSGRGLGFTGGTLDKLESIPGYKVELNFDEMKLSLEKVGCFIAGATASLAPADGILYKHRDVTSTVDSLSLITSSILSKKAAEGIRTLVMDLKVGCGAFLKTEKQARDLGRMMVEVAEGLGIRLRAVISKMDVPIGRYVGNALEIVEAIECLKNEGSRDVIELVKVLGGVVLMTEGLAKNLEEAKMEIERRLENGSALKKFESMIIQQGVESAVAKELCSGDIWKVLPKANHTTTLNSPKTGYISNINALDIANSCWYLGAGRSRAGDPIDYSVGVRFLKVVGDQINENEPWIEVHHKDLKLKKDIEELIKNSLTISTGNIAQTSRIIEIL